MRWDGFFFFGLVTFMYIKKTKPKHPLCFTSHFGFKVNLKICYIKQRLEDLTRSGISSISTSCATYLVVG